MSSRDLRGRACSNSTAASASRLLCLPWELVEVELPKEMDVPVSESLFSVGNGRVTVRGYTEESLVAPPYSRGTNSHDIAIRSPVVSLYGGIGNDVIKVGNRSLSNSHLLGNPSSPVRCDSLPTEGHPTASKEWKPPERTLRGTYVNGICEELLLTHHQQQRAFTVGTCARESFLVCAPDAFCIDVFVGGEHVNSETGIILSHRRTLDYHTGELRRHLVWQSRSNGHEVTIESSRIVSLTRRSIAAVKYSVSAKNVSNTNIRIVSRTIVPSGVRQHLKIENVMTRRTLHDASTAVLVRTRNSCKRLVVAEFEACRSTHYELINTQSVPTFSTVTSAVGAHGANTPPCVVAVDASLAAGRTPLASPKPMAQPQPQPTPSLTFLAPKCSEIRNGAETIYTSVIRESTRFELTKYIAFLVDEDAAPEDICDLGIHRAREAAAVTYEAICREQLDVLSNFWERGNVHIKASGPSLESAVRFNMLHLLMSSGGLQIQSHPSRGFMSQLQGGMHQWDVDAFIVPFFSHVRPEVARGLLQFRIDTLPQARSLAADVDLPRGALYPQRTVNGLESNPPPFCAAFLFTNAVVAYGMKQYITATNDFSILPQGGADVLFSTALIWLIWGTWDKAEFHVRSVGGPDDYSCLGDNNYFTNLMAKFHMQWAVQIAASMQRDYPNEWEGVKERCQLTDDDLAMMDKAAAKVVLVFDAKNRVHPVDQLFMRKKKWKFDELKKKKSLLFRTFDPSVVYRHQVCRIPDVVLASLLLPEKCTKDEVRANYNFYEPITTSDCSLTSMIFSIIAIQLDMLDKGMHYFHQSLFNDIENALGNTARGIHCSSAAGSWWCLTVGFGGMRVVDDTLHFNPVLPDAWEEYQFFVRHHGCLIKVLITRRMVTYTAVEGCFDRCGLPIYHTETNTIHLKEGMSESVRLYRDVRVFDFDCVVFNLDSLIEDLEDHHYRAWKQTLEKYLHEMGQTSFVLTEDIYLAYLKNGNSFTSSQRLLAKNGITNIPPGCPDDTVETDTVYGLLQRKRHNFRVQIREEGLKVNKGALHLMAELRQNGISIGCVTDSKSGQWMLRRVPQVMCLIDRCIDGSDGEVLSLCWRPEVDYFCSLCKQLNTSFERTIVIMRGIGGFSKSALEQFKLVVDVQRDAEYVPGGVHPVNVPCMSVLTLGKLDEYASKRKLVAVAGDADRPATAPNNMEGAPPDQLERVTTTLPAT
ncbi:glycosyl hydrolase [Trypanosoma brucei equiperdum]|uniref:Glycosyl hydrolase n=1 Tax=Trypanosoma brucei equiperdum TaxID=630700 RepID=A0A3L6KWI3_9TRYP|nr:glycosyl hydrolase [Trypanosoma brucei equiperdum]